MATTTHRSRKIAKITSVALGFGLGITAVLGFSNAAFQAQTDPNADNNWATAGSVTLDEQFVAPMFSFGLDGIGKPTSNNQVLSDWDGYLTDTGINGRQIDITYKGEVAADVRMFVSNKGQATNALDTKTLVTVTRDTDGSGPAAPVTIYDGVALSAMPGSYSAAASAELSHWNVAGSDNDQVATYAVSIKAAPGAPADSTLRGVEFKWEAQR
ncbi:MAG TPA: hypothetical protein VKB57_01370 [Acidimicrobiales bacterium]|nr:hypothetical protein [Acidimicrobiales bacterium]